MVKIRNQASPQDAGTKVRGLPGRCERAQRANEPLPNNKVIDWLTANEGYLVVDSMIMGELCVSILAAACVGLIVGSP